MDVRAGCKCEEEEADGWEYGQGQGRDQAFLVRAKAELKDARIHVVVDIDAVGEYS